ncbi:MAG: 50S ribosomal protein L15 [Candidatus Taylorbacteria bacterium]|nr:50S ribosomal protein L15 [Candidatus Taylorbacteria bacterium]
MQSNTLQRLHPRTKSARVGRGGTRGKTSGRGGKGQTARAGHKVRPEIRDMIKRIPKLRGRGKNIFQSFQARSIPVNLALLEKHFSNGDVVTPTILVEKGIVTLPKGAVLRIKILATGEITKKLTVTECTASESAKAKIEKAGGSVK